MEGNLFEALKLMVVGMVTVFVILLIVINMGKLLIHLVNKYAPEEVEPQKTKAVATVQAIDANVKAVLDAAVAQITGGKGHITNIKRI